MDTLRYISAFARNINYTSNCTTEVRLQTMIEEGLRHKKLSNYHSKPKLFALSFKIAWRKRCIYFTKTFFFHIQVFFLQKMIAFVWKLQQYFRITTWRGLIVTPLICIFRGSFFKTKQRYCRVDGMWWEISELALLKCVKTAIGEKAVKMTTHIFCCG